MPLERKDRFSYFRVTFSNGKSMRVFARDRGSAKEIAVTLAVDGLHTLPVAKVVGL